jgi:EmrB/QacA subfamily drug resistance transporter
MSETRTGVRLGEASGRWVLLATVLGSGMAFLDSTVVNVALPAIDADLDADVAGLQWTINGYTLTLAALILLGGSLGDRFGRRRVFDIGTALFALASLACAAAPTIGALVAGRALQGIGAALLTPGSLAIISATFAEQDRAKAIGAWSGLSGATTAVGPFLGGWMIDSLSWRWIFLLNLPLAVIVIAVASRHVPESRDTAASGRLDWAGTLLGAGALAGVSYALIAAGEDGPSPIVLTAGTVGLLAAAAFVVVERRIAAPMLPPGLFASRQFTAANLVTFAVYAALSGVAFLLVVQLQVSAGYSALAAGSALVPMTLLLLLFSSTAGAMSERIGPRLPMTVGPIVCGAGTLLLLRVDTSPSYLFDVLPAMIVFGLGLAITVAPLTATVLRAAPSRHVGAASGVNNAVARTAGLLAVAVLPLAAGIVGADFADPEALTAGFRVAMLICAGLLVAGGVLAAVGIRSFPEEAESAGDAGAKEANRRRSCPVSAPPLHGPVTGDRDLR